MILVINNVIDSTPRSYDLERVPINLTKVSKARPPAARVLEKLEHDNYLPSLSHIATSTDKKPRDIRRR